MPITARPLITSRTAGFRTALRLSWCRYLDQPEFCRHLLRLLVSDHVNNMRGQRADYTDHHWSQLVQAIRLTREKHSWMIRQAQKVKA